MLTKEQIFDAQDIKKELVEVPEWGGSVYVKMMTGEERDYFESSLIESKGENRATNMLNVRARLASLTICDENGHRLFNDKEAVALGKKSAKALSRVFDVAQKLNAIGKDEIDELAKNSEGGE